VSPTSDIVPKDRKQVFPICIKEALRCLPIEGFVTTMQGSFKKSDSTQLEASLGVDWASALVPGVDDETQDAIRRKEKEVELSRQVRNLRVPGGPPLAQVPRSQRPIPPAQSFSLKDRLFYIIGNKPDQVEKDCDARKGIWGHYSVPYYIDTGGLARPFLKTDTYSVTHVYSGDPGRARSGPPDGQPMPNMRYCQHSVDFVSADDDCSYWEVGLKKLTGSLEKAEEMDLAFARRMEGLGNVAQAAVWGCLDPDYDPMDRKALMEQFMGKYLDRFWAKTDTGNSPDIQKVSEEALHKHRTWCKAWAQKHYKCLTPAVTAPAEALAGEFYQYLDNNFHQDFKLSRLELARVFMRHPEIAPEFASCLYYYSTDLEHTRGGRNASYKQMSVITALKASSYTRLGNMLSEKSHVLREAFSSLSSEHGFYLHPYIVDWYSVLGQMPYVHRYFEEPTETWGGQAGGRAGNNSGNAPPWKIGRFG
jgi:hypothetical protein